MTLLDPTAGEVFTLRVFKRESGFEWANSYELAVTDDSVTQNDLVIAASAIVNTERQFHLSFIYFDRYTISTYVPDGEPYDPFSFTTETINAYGTRSVSGDVLGLALCAYVRRITQTGRPGKLFYRGVLLENDVVYSGGRILVVDNARALIQDNLNSVLTALPASIQLSLVAGNPQPQTIRPVVSFQCSPFGVPKQLRNRYYDLGN